MAECNSINYSSTERSSTNYNSPNIYPSFNDQQCRLNRISQVRDSFIGENKERELMMKRFSKYVVFLDYFDKSLIVLSVRNGSISVTSFATVLGVPVGIASASFSLVISSSTGIVKKLLKTTRNKKKKHNKIVMLPRSTLNSRESKISEALINN